MQIFQKISQRILMMARRREENDGEPGLPVSLQSDLLGNLYVNLVPTLPPGGDPGNYVAVDIPAQFSDSLASPTYALPVASFLYGAGAETAPDERDYNQLSIVHAAQAPAVTPAAAGVLSVAKPLQWSAVNTAAGGVQASATRAAPGAGLRNIVQGATFTMSGTAASLQDITVRIRDGAGGTILWESYIFKGASLNSVTIDLRDISLPCSVNTAAVAEFSAASGDPTTFESVTIWGVTVG